MSVHSDNKKWQEESDANTLAEAQVILSNRARSKGARTAAKRLADEQQKRATSLKKVARVPKKKPVKRKKK